MKKNNMVEMESDGTQKETFQAKVKVRAGPEKTV